MSNSATTQNEPGTAETAMKLAQFIIGYESKVSKLPEDQRRAYILDLVAESVEALTGYRKRQSK